MPNLKKLKNSIEKSMNNSPLGFIYSHEILFNKKISLKKYGKLIIFHGNKKMYKIISTLASEIKIPITNKYALTLNKFIDIIDNELSIK
jgi:hypothetical protein